MSEIIKLKNQATVIIVPKKETKAVDLIISFRIGSRYENEKTAGISHFFEHMMFNGTEKRPTSLDISKEIDGLGAIFNAHTSDEYTSYYISVSARYLPKAIEILGDQISNSKIAENDIKKEHKVIGEEIKMYEDMPSEYVSELFQNAIYSGDPLERSIAGSQKSINEITRDHLINFKKEFYVGENCFIGVGGNLSNYKTDQIVKMLEDNLIINTGKKTEIFEANTKPKKLITLAKDTAQTNLIIGYPGPSYNDSDSTIFRILSIIIGGNMSSRMFNKIREELKLAYDIRTSTDLTTKIGSIATQAGIANENLNLAAKSIIEEYERVKVDLSEDEVEKAKNYLIGQTEIRYEDSFDETYLILKNYFTSGKTTTIDEILDKIKSVTFSDVKKVANKYLDAEKMSVAVISPKKYLDNFKLEK